MNPLQIIGTILSWSIALVGIGWAGYYVYLFIWDCYNDLPTNEPPDVSDLGTKVRDEVDHILGKNY